MLTQYPVLGNRPINRWKVTELKEELKRRKLTTKGLKEDLIKRLDEAIRNEKGAFEEEASNNIGCEPELVVKHEDTQSNPNYVEMADDTWNHETKKFAKFDEVVAGVDINDGPAEMDPGKVQEEEAIGGTDSVQMIVGEPVLEASVETRADDTRNHEMAKTAKVDEIVAGVDINDGPAEMDEWKVEENESIGGTDFVAMIVGEPILEASVETNIKVKEVVAHIASSDKASVGNEINTENEDSNASLIDAVMIGELAALEASVETSGMVNNIVVTQTASSETTLQNHEIKMENEGSKLLQMDAECDVSDSNNQVYEVSPNLGFQVRSESISTDTLSVYEKNELKDNLNADNVHLELDVAKPEMVPPSSSKGPSNDGNLHPLGDNKPDGNQGFLEVTDDNKSTAVDFSKKNDSADGGSSMVLKLDHNLVDDSMGDEVLDKNPTDLKHNSNKVGDEIELIEVPISKDGSPVNDVGPDLSPDKMETSAAKAAATEEKRLQDDSKSTPVDLSERTDMADEGPLEKINLDHSSADDSLEEDAMETKQIDSNHNSIEVAENIELTEVPGVGVGGIVDAVGPDFSSDKLESSSEKKDNVAAVHEKRKFQDAAAVGNKEPLKRQRRWNSESLKIPETQSSNLSLFTAPKDLVELKGNLPRSESTLSGDAPKERVAPPSSKPPTNSLRIDHFLRPFTLKAVQELLARTGNVCSFWMDHIKTHCYVMYSSVEEAIETRNSVYNLQWPQNGGRLLVAEFVDPEEVKLRVEAPPTSSATPVSTSPTAPATRASIQPPPSARQHGLRQRLLPQPPLAQPPPVSDPLTTGERLPLPSSPPLPEKVNPPIVTLDDLFRKTRATPRIYYLPLTEEQVAAKLTSQRKNKQ
uniref:Putative apoptotic chromatin condensation inducer in the nucleus-like isoform X1 n=2 Tax=Davidia involucrata TaxID=16924 RepID=A0A5B6Z9Y9_DAVIN